LITEPNHPDPFTPADLDLRNHGWMPFSIARMVDDPALVDGTAEQFRAAFRLWLKCWHQVPAASLPNDDRLLARWAGYDGNMPAWRKVREVALTGFVLCNDGRLYSGPWAHEALEAGKLKRDRELAKEADRVRKALSRADEKRKLGGIQPVLPLVSVGLSSGQSLVSDGRPIGRPTDNALTDRQTDKQEEGHLPIGSIKHPDQLAWIERLETVMGRPWPLIHPLRWATFPEIVRGWRADAIDLEGVVVPVVTQIMATLPEFPKTPKYLDTAVRAQAARLADAPRTPPRAFGRPAVVSTAQSENARWTNALTQWRRDRTWAEDRMGDPPSSPSFAGPRDMLTPEDLIPTLPKAVAS